MKLRSPHRDDSIIHHGPRTGESPPASLAPRPMFSLGAINHFFIPTTTESSPAQTITTSALRFVTTAFQFDLSQPVMLHQTWEMDTSGTQAPLLCIMPCPPVP